MPWYAKGSWGMDARYSNLGEDEYHVEIEKHPNPGKPRVICMYPGDHIRGLGAVVVEGWKHVVPNVSRSGSKYRKYCAEFNEKERKTAGTWHRKYYNWELRTGYPQEIGMTVATYSFLVRLANFFASV